MAVKPRPDIETLGANTTGGYNSAEISIEGFTKEIHLVCSNMANGDGDCVLQINESSTIVPSDDDWADFYIDGTKQIITQTAGSQNNGLVLRGPGTFRIVKPTTAAAGQVLALSHHTILVNA